MPPSPIPGAAEGLGGPAVDALREPAVNSFHHATHVSNANMQATLAELVDCSQQLSSHHTCQPCQYAGNTARISRLQQPAFLTPHKTCKYAGNTGRISRLQQPAFLMPHIQNMPICRQHCQNKWTAATSFPYATHTEHANMQATLAEVADCCFTMAVIVTKTSACLSHIAESVSMSMT